MSSTRQQWSASKHSFRNQKSIDVNDKPPSDSKKVLRKQLSVEHVTPSLKHQHARDSASPPVPLTFTNLLWRNSTQSLNEENLKIISVNAVKKRAQYAATSIIANSSIANGNSRQELLNSCLNNMKTPGEATMAKDRINIKLFLSSDVLDDGFSDHDGASHAENRAITNKTPSPSSVAPKSATTTADGNSSRLSVNARRAQFQASRRIMSAPIRPLNMDDSKGKRKARKKKVIRDKDEPDDSPDDLVDEVEEKKATPQTLPSKASSKSKNPPTRSRSVLGCDQVGIETLVSMLSSGGSDSEKEEIQAVQPLPPARNDMPRIRTNMLRKTVSFQDDDGMQTSTNKDLPFIYRRSTFAPFVGRMKNTRNMFGQDITNPYVLNEEEKQQIDKNENDLNSTNKPDNEVNVEKPKSKKASEEKTDDKKTQDIKTPKEEECWRLYEKMRKTGLNVSYDTILRGILKPSELRLLEKQKKLLGNIEETTNDGTELEAQHEPQAVN